MVWISDRMNDCKNRHYGEPAAETAATKVYALSGYAPFTNNPCSGQNCTTAQTRLIDNAQQNGEGPDVRSEQVPPQLKDAISAAEFGSVVNQINAIAVQMKSPLSAYGKPMLLWAVTSMPVFIPLLILTITDAVARGCNMDGGKDQECEGDGICWNEKKQQCEDQGSTVFGMPPTVALHVLCTPQFIAFIYFLYKFALGDMKKLDEQLHALMDRLNASQSAVRYDYNVMVQPMQDKKKFYRQVAMSSAAGVPTTVAVVLAPSQQPTAAPIQAAAPVPAAAGLQQILL